MSEIELYYGNVTLYRWLEDDTVGNKLQSVGGRILSESGLEKLYHRLCGRTTAQQRLSLLLVEDFQMGKTCFFGTSSRDGGQEVQGKAWLYKSRS